MNPIQIINLLNVSRIGALLIAVKAVDQNRDVFAVMVWINDPQNVSANHLICNGATLISSGAEIIRHVDRWEAFCTSLGCSFSFLI